MSFLRKLFGGGGGGGDKPAAAGPSREYNGFVIFAEPFPEGGQHQVAGRVTKEIGGVTREHRFIRADRMASKDDAVDMAFRKGQQIVDERGDKIFD